MRRILAGIETEYGLLVSGRGAAEQIDDSKALVRSYPGECLSVWDYRQESPRNDLRGFKQSQLTFDPEDAKFDVGHARGPDPEVRADRILPNGARLYNDHGHPEYSTPECLSLGELALHDKAGELAVLDAALAFAESSGQEITLYKNNTDFHGASYGTHENYLVPRDLGFEGLYAGIMPMLVVRQILTGAGKVGAETGDKCAYQISQRADFFSELFNVNTLFRRPLFNTRDEPHADPSKWIRLHVISGDANMMALCTSRKAALVKLAIHLVEAGEAPLWRFQDPVKTFQELSRDQTFDFKIPLEGKSWTTAYDVLESYFAAARSQLDIGADAELAQSLVEAEGVLTSLRKGGPPAVQDRVDWAAKRMMLQSFMEEEGMDWNSPALSSYDLEYHNVDRSEGLFHALEGMGSLAEAPVSEDELRGRLRRHSEPTRAFARGLATSRFSQDVETAGWRAITFKRGDELLELQLPPDLEYGKQLEAATDVEEFIKAIGEINERRRSTDKALDKGA